MARSGRQPRTERRISITVTHEAHQAALALRLRTGVDHVGVIYDRAMKLYAKVQRRLKADAPSE